MSDLPAGAIELDLKDLKGNGKCKVCQKPILVGIIFHRIEHTQFVVDRRSIQQMGGMLMYFQGHGELAQVFSPSSRVGMGVPSESRFICHECWTKAILEPEKAAAVLFFGSDDD